VLEISQHAQQSQGDVENAAETDTLQSRRDRGKKVTCYYVECRYLKLLSPWCIVSGWSDAEL